ncbi:hypothetical protein J437_LFUL012672 [Ladona fulva]|uniref:SET domain-containing protein n=1 Tax=Ladona fulva TaxID=123851 RepID=A0A8K0KCF4_LADFU|nr:hypothetical protein J437_LFUL012672 [Ladona fulva]
MLSECLASGQHLGESSSLEDPPFTISRSDVLGRFLEASRDIRAGQLVLRESPCAVGPQPGAPFTCIGCLRRIAAPFCKCPMCSVAPFCSVQCTNGQMHSDRECGALRRRIRGRACVTLQPQTVLPLRCFLLQWTLPDKWKALMELEGHEEERQGTAVWQSVDAGVVAVLLGMGIITPEDRDTLQRICSILDVNSFEVRGPEGEPLRAIYPTAALLAHDCTPSAFLGHEPEDMSLVIRAAIDLKKGDLITHNYAGTLLPSIERRDNLRKGKYFECRCRRCADPFELGTNLGSLRCCGCGVGPVVPKDPMDRHSDWKCDRCGRVVSGALAEATYFVARGLLERSDRGDEEVMELLLQKLSESFYPGHALLLEVGQILAGLYNEHSAEWMMSPRPNYALIRRWRLCEGLLKTLNKLEPGISRMKGVCMYEMAVCMTTLAAKGRETATIKAKDVSSILRQSECLLKQSVANLLFEPQGSPEQKLIYSAFRALRRVKELLHGEKETLHRI